MSTPVIISYKDAQMMIPYFQAFTKIGPTPEARKEASIVLQKLKTIRDIDYSPLGGAQVWFTNKQKEFLEDTFGIIG